MFKSKKKKDGIAYGRSLLRYLKGGEKRGLRGGGGGGRVVPIRKRGG